MAERNINVFTSRPQPTGTNVLMAQYEINLKVISTNDAGEKVTRSAVIRWPNILAQVPAAWLLDEMQDLLLRAVRKYWNVDD